MKYTSLFVGMLTIATLFSCSDAENEVIQSNVNQNANMEEKRYAVSMDDIKKLVNLPTVNTRSSVVECDSIKIFTGDSGDTLFYIVNHAEGGWTMYASDKRVPAVVAISDEGTYEQAITNDALYSWICDMSDDMKQVKKASNNKLKISIEEQKNNIEYWESFCNVDEFIAKHLPQTKVSRAGDFIGFGHYEYYDTFRSEELYRSVDHLVTTRWSQGSPFNTYCPLAADGSRRCPAGCVAIAASQMLKFLHDTMGVPKYAPSTAYCYGTENNYTWGVSDEDSTIWDAMPNDESEYYNYNAAPLILKVGKLVNTDYGKNASGADTEDLPDDVFAYYGISCTFCDYDASVATSCLLNGKPVIARARHRKSTIIPSYVGHCFIIDGYKQYRTKTSVIYRWVYDAPAPGEPMKPVPEVPEDIRISYSSPHVSYIRMNWGWGSNGAGNDTWFALTDDWITQLDEDVYSFTHSKKMIYNFNKIEP